MVRVAKKDPYGVIGKIISLTSDLELQFNQFISYYFLWSFSPKTDFFKSIVLSKFSFEDKITLFQKICKKEGFDNLEIKNIMKDVRFIQNLRNNVAHWNLKTSKSGGFYFTDRKKLKSFNLEEINISEILKKINSLNHNFKHLLSDLKRNGSFETRSDFLKIKSEWGNAFKRLKEYVDKNSKIPHPGLKSRFEKQMGWWCFNQRKLYYAGELDDEKIFELESVKGWHWGREDIWNKNYFMLKEFIEENKKFPAFGTDLSSKKLISSEELFLSNWCKEQRKRRKELSQERISALEMIEDWVWSPDMKWNKIYIKVVEFVNKNKILPKMDSKNKLEKKLGIWCYVQRNVYKGNTPAKKLDKLKIKKLEQINAWHWGRTENKWGNVFQVLLGFIKKNNRLPNYMAKNNDDRFLVSWCERQRRNYSKRYFKL